MLNAAVYLFSSIEVSILHFVNMAIGAMKVLEANNLFHSLFAAASISKNFAYERQMNLRRYPYVITATLPAQRRYT